MARSKQSESNPEATRYDVNRTLSTYRPVNTAPVGGVAVPQYVEGSEDNAPATVESPKVKKRFSFKNDATDKIHDTVSKHKYYELINNK